MEIEAIFKPENQSIEQIFGNTDAFYQMPIYQRPYAWDKERVEQLWYDILEAYKNNKENKEIDQNYFLGSVVLVKKLIERKNKTKIVYEVVDGQQRLTTLTILFCTLRDLNLDLEEEEESTISDSIKSLKGKEERLKLTTHLNNQALFEETIINGIDFNSSKKDNRFLQTAHYFKRLIEECENVENEDFFVENISDFVDYLLRKTTMIKIVCYDENFAIKLFSVLNDRGLDLSAVDIIKAYLLQNLEETKHNNFIEVWKQIEDIAKYSNDDTKGIFNLYLYYLKAGNPKRTLQDELKEQFKSKLKTKNPQQIILEVKKFAENYRKIQSNNKDKYISMLRYLPQSIYWKTILTTALYEEYSQYEELKKLITQYYYQSWIAEGTSNRIKQTSFNIIEKVKNKESISEIKKIIDENLKKYNNYKNYLSAENVYSTRWIKPVLLSIEYFQHEEKDFIPIKRDLHIEHILPKEWNRENLNWKDKFTKNGEKLTIDEVNKKLNTLGNLTLLSGHKNIEASNRNYQDKKEIYRGNSGKGFDGITSFEMTKRILDDHKTWNCEELNNRYKWLLFKIEDIFDF